MKTFLIKDTDLEVSRLAYGTWHLGGHWDDLPLGPDEKSRAVELLNLAVDLGMTLIDLADIYVRGKSDQVVGYALAQSPGLRDRVVLQAKCGIVLRDWPSPGDPGRYDFSCEHIVAALEATLTKLGTDHVELLLLHRPDPLVEPAEVARAFDQLEFAGKVRYFGVSNHTAGQLALLSKFVRQPLVVNQLQLSLAHHDLITDGFLANSHQAQYSGASGTLDYCRFRDITVQAWSPVARGQLLRPPKENHQLVALAHEISSLATKYSTSPEAMAIAWLLRHPAGIQPIIGTMNADRLRATALADTVQLTRPDWYRLLAAARGAGVP